MNCGEFMFLGNYSTHLDKEKGRTSLPSVFRKEVGDVAIVTKGYEGSLLLITKANWEKVIGSVTGQSFLSAFSRQTDRYLLGNAFEIHLDSQGRFVIPQALRSYAELGKSIIFVGVGNRIEIWDQSQWIKNDQYLSENSAQLSEKLDEKSKE